MREEPVVGQIGRDAGLQVEAGGAGFGEPIAVKTTSELVGLAVAFVVLVVTFGSLAASVIPLISAVVGVGIGALLVLLTTHWVELNNVTPVLAVMIGLAGSQPKRRAAKVRTLSRSARVRNSSCETDPPPRHQEGRPRLTLERHVDSSAERRSASRC